MDLWNGLVRGCLNLSRATRSSAVKRIGYRTFKVCVSERGSRLTRLQMEVAPRFLESSSICIKAIYAYRGRFFFIYLRRDV
jgi:hypothetical protein